MGSVLITYPAPELPFQKWTEQLKCSSGNGTAHWQGPINIIRALKIKAQRSKSNGWTGRMQKADQCRISQAPTQFHIYGPYVLPHQGGVAHIAKLLWSGIMYWLLGKMNNEWAYILPYSSWVPHPRMISKGSPMGNTYKVPKPYFLTLLFQFVLNYIFHAIHWLYISAKNA